MKLMMYSKSRQEDTLVDITKVVTSRSVGSEGSQIVKIPPSLILLMGPKELVGEQWLLEGPIYVVGRSRSNSIVVPDISVSKAHLKIEVNHCSGVVRAMDLESTNGFFLNSKKQPPLQFVKLQNNDQLAIGRVTLKFLKQGSVEASVNQRMHAQSLMDPLTEVHNKRSFIKLITERIRMPEPLSLIVFDIDHFKKINDNYGHLCGDYVLKNLAQKTHQLMLRDDDILARYGGEEFCIITAQGVESAYSMAERIRTNIENTQFDFENHKIKITVSLGVEEYRSHYGDNWEAFFSEADRALLLAKSQGRNCTVKAV